MRRFCRCRDPDRSRHHAICSRVARRSYGPWAIGTSFGTLRASVARSHRCRDAALATRNIRFTGIFCDGETRTRTGDTTNFRRYVLAAASGEIPGEHLVSEGPARRAEIRNLRSFQRVSGDARGSSLLCAYVRGSSRRSRRGPPRRRRCVRPCRRRSRRRARAMSGPLASRKCAVSRNAERLLASGSGGLLARCASRTAACSGSVG